ncbi:DUF1543 domain-containing protein [Alkanindiges sp. WGS2144]|uniref:DUF1543 domain-containing protein n=1 Tax=Alkanindiges sp. WGS2144 TaxID=3366808 RepID=UPI0037530CD5
MLYAVMLGGKHDSANIEVHDVVFVSGDSLEVTHDQLREQWFGRAKGLHVDAWMAIDGIEQYRVQLKGHPVTKGSPRLYFINLGGYIRQVFGEAHCYFLVVAPDLKTARAKAKKHFDPDWYKPHIDAAFELDDCVLVDQVAGQYVHLVEGSHLGVEFENTYLVIG